MAPPRQRPPIATALLVHVALTASPLAIIKLPLVASLAPELRTVRHGGSAPAAPQVSPERYDVPESQHASSCQQSRRDHLRSLTRWGAFGAYLTSRPAYALKPQNEALCGTGFFTNIAQYKCTDIGDISDEGKSRKMTDDELGKLDSLMGKIGVEGGGDPFGSGGSADRSSGAGDGAGGARGQKGGGEARRDQ